MTLFGGAHLIAVDLIPLRNISYYFTNNLTYSIINNYLSPCVFYCLNDNLTHLTEQ